MRYSVPIDSFLLKPGEDGQGGKAAMAASRDRKRGR